MKTCTQCGTPMTSDSPEGLCARCLLSVAMKDDPAATTVDSSATQNASPGASAVAAATIDIGDAAEVARRLPQFEILELLGRGGMGVVYKARQIQLDRLVALKILPPGDATSPGFVERFRREARSLAKLSHPNIVHLYEFGETNGLYFFVMEFVDGLNLRQMILAHRLTPAEALAVVPKICDALQFAHEEGVVHRDIKPENILIDKKGRVKIADFGLVKLLRREQSDMTLTHTGATLGTPRYMAPEQMDKPETVDHRADIYSLGVVFYEMLTGELPMGRFAPPSHKVQIDVRLDEIVLHALERDVELRYQHASEVRDAVEEVTSKPPATTTQQVGKPGAVSQPVAESPAPLCRRFPLRYLLLFTLIFAVAWFAALAFWNLRYPGVVLGGVVIFAAINAVTAMGRRHSPIIATTWKNQSRLGQAARAVIVLAICVAGYYFVLGGTFAGMERLFWSFQYRDAGGFERAYTGKEYQLVRQLSAYKENVPQIELSGGGDWNVWRAPITALFGNCGPDFDRFSLTAILCQLAIGSILLTVAVRILILPKPWEIRRGPDWHLFVLPQLRISVALAAGWGVWVLAWFILFGSHVGRLGRDADSITFYPTNAGPFEGGYVGSKLSVNAPLQDVDKAMQEVVAAEGYALSDFYSWGMKTVPQGVYIGSAQSFYAWKPSPFDRWHWTRGVLAGSGPSISVEYISTYNPQETVVHITLAQTIGEHLDGEPAVAMLRRLVEAAKYGKSTLHPTPLAVAPLSLLPGQSNLRVSLPHGYSTFSVAFSHDGKTLASGSGDHSVELWSVATGAHLTSLQASGNGGSVVAFSPDGQTVATDGGYDRKDIVLWNVATGKVKATMRDTDLISMLDFSPDGTLLASGGLDHTVKLWDMATGKVKFSLAEHTGGVSAVAFSRDGKKLASASADKTVKIWDVATGKCNSTIRNLNGVGSVAFSPDGRHVAGATVGKVEIWDVASSQTTASIATSDWVRSVAFSPDGTVLACGGTNNPIKLWDAASQKLIVTLGNDGTVPSLAFSPDGKTLASAGWDKTVKLWNVGFEKKAEK